MTITIAPPTCAVVFDEPTTYVDRSLATASWWDKYEIQPGTYPLEWTRNGKPWNADPEAITPGFIANVGPQEATAYLQARLVESYREARLLHHVTADQQEHPEAEIMTLTRSVYAFQVPGCPKPPHGTPITTFLGGRVVRL